MVESLDSVKEKILQVVHVLAQQGHMRSFGHVSVRIPGTDRFLITGKKVTIGRTLEDLTTRDLLLVGLDGTKLEGAIELPSEIFIHSCLYKTREEVNSVIHCHPIYSLALGIAGKPLLPLSIQALYFAPFVPIYDDHNLIDTEERGQKMVRAMGKGFAVVLRGHGIVTAGRDLEEAAGAVLCLEETARIQLMASQVGEPRALVSGDTDEEFRGSTEAGHGMRSLWLYYQGQAGRDRKKA